MHNNPATQQGLRVTLVTGSLDGGGSQRIVLWLAGSLARSGHQVTVVTLHDAKADFYDVPPSVTRIKAEEPAGMTVRWFDVVGQYRSIKALKQTLEDNRPDVVLSFIESVNVQVLLAMIGSGIPVIVSEQSDWRFQPVSMRWRIMRHLLYPQALQVVVLSRELEGFAAEHHPNWRCIRIPNPVPEITFKTIEKPQEFGQFNVMAMGRLAPEKGFDLLLHAFKKVAPDLPEWKLVIIGEGPERAGLEKLANDLLLADRVLLAGALSPPFDWLHAGDLFVFSSRHEGFGLALAEAMACGLPVISFNCPSGPRDIVRDGIDGILVPPNNIGALSDAMGNLMGDPLKRHSLGLRAPEVCQRFSPQAVFDQWHSLIRTAAGLTE